MVDPGYQGLSLARLISGAAKANENVCDDGVYFDGDSNVLRFDRVFDRDSLSLFVSSAQSLSMHDMPAAPRYRVLFHPALTCYDATRLAEDHREGVERRHAAGHFREEL